MPAERSHRPALFFGKNFKDRSIDMGWNTMQSVDKIGLDRLLEVFTRPTLLPHFPSFCKKAPHTKATAAPHVAVVGRNSLQNRFNFRAVDFKPYDIILAVCTIVILNSCDADFREGRMSDAKFSPTAMWKRMDVASFGLHGLPSL